MKRLKSLIRDRQELERAVRDDDRVVIAGRDARHGLLPVAGGEVRPWPATNRLACG